MGSSAAAILASRRSVGDPFTHWAIDPFGLQNGSGSVVESYLVSEFGDRFVRIWLPSQIALPDIVRRQGAGCSELIFIDGGHRFDDVFCDFAYADVLCGVGGHIVFDDALFPAIETVLNYICANRPDYAIAWFPVPNTAVIRKLRLEVRRWDAFTPFLVPQRRDWTAATPAPAQDRG